MPKDAIIWGATAGILGNIPKTIIAWLFHFLGYLRYTFIHIAAGYFVPAKFIDNNVSLLTGFIADYTMAAFFGFVMFLMLSKMLAFMRCTNEIHFHKMHLSNLLK